MSFGLYVCSGLFIGFLVGLTGVGGGSLMTPLLILLFGIHPGTAVGSDLLYAAVTTASLLVYRTAPLRLFATSVGGLRPSRITALTVAIGAVLGCLVSFRMPDIVLRPALRAMLLVTLVQVPT